MTHGARTHTHAPAQVDTYKYVVWVPGNCASVRLALQLASDALVLKVNPRAHFWYTCSLCTLVHVLSAWWAFGVSSRRTRLC